MKEKHPGLPTIRAISVLYMIFCAVGSRFSPVDPVYFFPGGLSLPTIDYMDGQDEQDETRRNYESTKLRKQRKSQKRIYPAYPVHPCYMLLCSDGNVCEQPQRVKIATGQSAM
ncbi:MAG: hypothetical protein OXR72_18180 [Gemmatimonadota bacterium]|nr:hypothetical protein [Gemmatimonadota bacterium]